MTVLAMAAILAALDLLLLASGYRLLVGEWLREDYMPAVVPQGRAIKTGETLECDYFTGRGVHTAPAHRYIADPDQCPVIVRHE
ncbi:MAG: hypothetical protein AB7E60_00140 [Sphingobium sp.]